MKCKKWFPCLAKSRYLLVLLGMCCLLSWIFPPKALANEKVAVMSINHANAVSFSRDGDYYNPNGRILFSVNKHEYPTIETLDELFVFPSNEGREIAIALVGAKGPVAMKSYSIEEGKYLHLVTSWNIANKSSGTYIFAIMVDKEIVAKYAIEIKD